MYKGYYSYRGYLNAKLHAVSIKICGDTTVLNDEIVKIVESRKEKLADAPEIIEVSTKSLTDKEAANLYHKLLSTLNSVSKNVTKAKDIIGSDDSMTVGQRKAMIKITKYDFHWSPEATFSFILQVLPAKRKRLSSWEIQNSKLLKLYTLISRKEADKIIKRLDKIIKRNKENAK
jgi:hypothetical protein